VLLHRIRGEMTTCREKESSDILGVRDNWSQNLHHEIKPASGVRRSGNPNEEARPAEGRPGP